jgi:ferredoxin-NADP reductase
MLLDLDHRGRPVNATLLYAHRTTDVVYQGELDALRRRHPSLVVRHVVSPEHITKDVIRAVAPDPASPVFYVSGPEPFVQAVEGMLAGLGVPDASIKRDYFPGYEWA